MGKWSVSGVVVVTGAVLGSTAMAVGCGGTNSTDPVRVGVVEQPHLSGGSSGSGSSSGGSGSSGGGTCPGVSVSASEPSPLPTCEGYDPNGNAWPAAEQLVAWVLSTATDANGNNIQMYNWPSGGEGMACFMGSMVGGWLYYTFFVTSTLEIHVGSAGIDLPTLSSSSCSCSMQHFADKTLVSNLLDALSGPPYEFIKGARGSSSCHAPAGTTEYNGEPNCPGGCARP